MRKLILLLLVASMLSTQTFSQITYGKEDCGPMFNRWITYLYMVKEMSNGGMDDATLGALDGWLKLAGQDVSEGQFRILQKSEGDGPVLFSLINTLHNSRLTGISPIKTESEKGLSFDEFSNRLNELPSERNVFHALSVVFNMNMIDKEIREDKQMGIDPRESFFRFAKPGEPDINADTKLNSFYTYLLELAEFDRSIPMDREFEIVYGKSEDFFARVTGVIPPPYSDKENVKKYLRQFTWELLYAFDRCIYLPASAYNAFEFNPKARYAANGTNRMTHDYFIKIFASYLNAQLSVLIDHISNLKKNCAPPDSGKFGTLSVGSSKLSIPQEEEKEIELPKKDPAQGMTWLIIFYKNSEGKYLAKNNIAKLYKLDAAGKQEYYGGRYLNTYIETDPGEYLIKFRHYIEDSIQVTVSGNITPASFPQKGSLQVYGQAPDESEVDIVNARIEKLRQNPGNAYQLDTVFLGLMTPKDQPYDLSPGRYRIGIRMPANYYPQVHYAEAEITEHNKTFLQLTGYGRLLVKTPDGAGKPKQVQVNIFSSIKDPQTGKYTFLRKINGMDTLNMKPGNYRIQVEYGFPITREVTITSSQLSEENFDNIGSLTVRKPGSNTQWVDIIDNNTQAKTAMRSGSTMDLLSDRTYTVEIKTGSGNPKTFYNVRILPNQTTTINW